MSAGDMNILTPHRLNYVSTSRVLCGIQMKILSETYSKGEGKVDPGA
jgi:hypothetical protein